MTNELPCQDFSTDFLVKSYLTRGAGGVTKNTVTAICGLIFNFQNLPDLRSSPDQISPKHNTIQSIYIYPARLLLKVNCNFMVHFEQIKTSKSQQTLTCPKLTINILQKGVKNV